MMTVDWSKWMQLTHDEQEALRQDYRDRVRREAEVSLANNYAKLNAALGVTTRPKGDG